MLYSTQDLNDLVYEVGMEQAILSEVDAESIDDPSLAELWAEARVALVAINERLAEVDQTW